MRCLVRTVSFLYCSSAFLFFKMLATINPHCSPSPSPSFPNRRADLMLLNVPSARKVKPPPLPEISRSASLRSPRRLPRGQGVHACDQVGANCSRNASNASSCSLDTLSSSDDDIWGCNGRCKVLHEQSRASIPADSPIRLCAAQAVAAHGPVPHGATSSVPCTPPPARLLKHRPSSGGGDAVR